MILKTEVIVEEIERRSERAGLSISELSRRANLSRSTFQRWKAGEVDPSLNALRKVHEVLEAEEQSKAAAPL